MYEQLTMCMRDKDFLYFTHLHVASLYLMLCRLSTVKKPNICVEPER
jgi:hypothetical protein